MNFNRFSHPMTQCTHQIYSNVLSFLWTVNTECAAIAESERVDCGWSDITRLECEANMCCYSSNGTTPCYFKEGKQRELFRWHHYLLMMFHQLLKFCSLSFWKIQLIQNRLLCVYTSEVYPDKDSVTSNYNFCILLIFHLRKSLLWKKEK